MTRDETRLVPGRSLGRVAIGDAEMLVREKVGDPETVEHDHDLLTRGMTFGYPSRGFAVKFRDGRVRSMSATSGAPASRGVRFPLWTDSGMTMDSSAAQVDQAFGSPADVSISEKFGCEWRGYAGVSVSFDLTTGAVLRVLVDEIDLGAAWLAKGQALRAPADASGFSAAWFWERIAEGRARWPAMLDEMSEEGRRAFREWAWTYCHEADRDELWAAFYLRRGGAAEADFLSFRMWLVEQGEQTYLAAAVDPDGLATLDFPIEEPAEFWVDPFPVAGDASPSDGALDATFQIPRRELWPKDRLRYGEVCTEEQLRALLPTLSARSRVAIRSACRGVDLADG